NLAHNVFHDSRDTQSGAPASCDNESNSAKPSTCRSRIYIQPGLVLWCTITINQHSCLLRGGHFMAKIHDSTHGTICGTPPVRLNILTKDLGAEVLVKVVSFNPAHFVKDRIGKAIIDAAEASGELKPGGTVVEATSGNTGIALALVGAAR